ncbi:hypothetical protein J7T55_014942 [Diaporthe amygdali]|uniref:uncharacterized protein n=1 Tax=Phomopsis amygdali TaxID=1214568 RepID=UPI0022FEB6F3|nr:uncharacterized protein J7T55_014942 [Diaporthe amygdali]KAJ0106866.1 hypothetical protein J7T55_014942 [Diaporthe amygdali]
MIDHAAHDVDCSNQMADVTAIPGPKFTYKVPTDHDTVTETERNTSPKPDHPSEHASQETASGSGGNTGSGENTGNGSEVAKTRNENVELDVPENQPANIQAQPTTCVDIDIDIDQGGTGEDIVSVEIAAAAAAVIAIDQTGMIIEEEDTRQHKDLTIAPGLGQFRGDAMGPLPNDSPRARDEVHDLRSMIRLKRVILLTNAVIIAILVFIIAATYILAQEATGVDQQKAKRQGLQIMMI